MTTPIVLFPDATNIAIDYLDTALSAHSSTVGVYSKVPNPRPNSFVTIRRSGGVRQTLVSDAAALLIECWALTEEAANDLAQLARALLYAMRGTVQDGVAIYHVLEFAGPAELPDSESDQPRVVFTMQIQMRGTAIS